MMTNSKYFQYWCIALCSLLFIQCQAPKDKPADHYLELLVGTYTNGTSEGVYKTTFNPQSGAIHEAKLVAKLSNPSYLELTNDRSKLLTISESDGGSVYLLNRSNDLFDTVQQIPSGGAAPCHIAFNANTGHVAVANYMGGNVSLFQLDNNRLQLLNTKQHSGNGPNTQRQESAHAHQVQFSPDNRFLYVVDLGIDAVMMYGFLANGSLDSGQVALQLEPGDGPRHLTIHPQEKMVFILNELSSTVVSAKIDSLTGLFTTIDRQSTLPESFTEHNQCAAIQITSDGQFLYTSNRGHDSIACFRVAEDGTLSLINTVSVEGKWPRFFTLSPDEHFLLVANKNTDNVTVFKRNPETGLLQFTGFEMKVGNPSCLVFN